MGSVVPCLLSYAFLKTRFRNLCLIPSFYIQVALGKSSFHDYNITANTMEKMNGIFTSRTSTFALHQTIIILKDEPEDGTCGVLIK